MAGQSAVALTRTLLNATEAEAWAHDPGAGAVVSFVGVTRNQHEGKPVATLEYEAREPMAVAALETICREALQKFAIQKICVRHRLGVVPIGEASVVIAVGSAHRAAAFDACRYAIDTLKTTVPIWKKEHYADGSPASWVGPDGKPVVV